MTVHSIDRQIRDRLAVLRHADEVSKNVAATCRHYGITRQTFYIWERRFKAEGPDGLRERYKASMFSPRDSNSEIVVKFNNLRKNEHCGHEKNAMM